MRRVFVIACVAALLPAAAAAQPHTLVALSHADFTAYEIDPATGAVVHKFTAQNQPHEGVASPDGRAYYLAVPNGPHVVVLDGHHLHAEGDRRVAVLHLDARTRARPRRTASPSPTTAGKVYVGLENADIPGIVVIDTPPTTCSRRSTSCCRAGTSWPSSPKTGKLYYPMREDHRVLVIDTATDTITKIIPIPGGPVGVGFAPNGEVWIHNDGDGTVHVIDSAKTKS